MSPARKEPDTSTYSGRFAVRLRELREEAGLSVEELVERIAKNNETTRRNPAKPAVYQWEQGKGMPHLDLLPAIRKALNLKAISDLLPKS